FMLKCSSDKIRQELWSKDDPTLHEVITIAKGVEHTLACVGELEKNKYPSVNKIGPKNESQENNVLEVDGKKDELKLSQIQKSKFKDTKCFRCGNLGHFASYKKCPAIAAVCKLCGKRGHFAKCCRSPKELPSTSIKVVQDRILMVEDRVTEKKYPKDIVNLGGVMCEVLFDSGAWLTLMSNETFDKYLSHSVKLKNPNVVPGGYGGQAIDLRGYFESKIEFKSNSIVGKIYVPVKGDSVISWPHQKDLEVILDPNNPTPVMLKKDFKNDVNRICKISDVVSDSVFPDFVNEFKSVFTDTLGCLTKYVHRIKLKENAVPIVCKVRPIPISVREDVQKELHRLCQCGIIEPVEASEWVSPVVVARKPSGEIRLCVDLRNLNKAVVSDVFPLPNIS
ncbi:hypothetical protein NDU88_004839, partial [Pleurodeles waltl]